MFDYRHRPQDQKQHDERLKLVFDYCKHLATLAVGTGVVFVALSNQVGLESVLATIGPLIFFGTSAMLSLWCMVSVIGEIGTLPTQESSTTPHRRFSWWWRMWTWPIMLEFATGSYYSGILLILLYTFMTKYHG